MDGGVFGLLRVVAQHRGAVEYDLRHRFNLSLYDVGNTVSIFEVARLVVIVRADPSSAIAAAVEGWDHPITREALVLMDLFDLDMAVAAGKKKPKPYQRPWKQEGDVKRMGNTGGRSRAEVVAILNGLGHSLPV